MKVRISLIFYPYDVAVALSTVFANASVTVDGDTATLTLTASVNGTFHCELDVGSFQACKSVYVCILYVYTHV